MRHGTTVRKGSGAFNRPWADDTASPRVIDLDVPGSSREVGGEVLEIDFQFC
jgi:hypothetical protein